MLQKEDLIAELKMSKDITGIKKLKVERAKVEEQQEKEMFSEITRQLTANSFVEKVCLCLSCWRLIVSMYLQTVYVCWQLTKCEK
jgi:hypothetical protein